MIKNRACLITALTATFVCTPLVSAADDSWYIAPGLNYIVGDNDRNADDDFGLKLGIGKQLNEKWNIETSFVFDKLDRSSGAGEFDQKGIIVDGLYYMNRNKEYNPFFIVGAGLLKTDFTSSSDTNLALNVGVGIERKLTDSGIGLRGDIRYRLDDDSTSLAGQDRFSDWMVGLSVKFPFGGKTKSKPVAVVATKKPKPAPSDGDKDGVIDAKDKCPNSVEYASVDVSGCEVMVLRGVNFETNSAKLTSASRPILDAAVTVLKRRGDIKLEVAGHTDSQGAESYNRSLSEARAIAVRDYLISNGIKASNLSARGYGSMNAIASNNTSAGRASNRRVELRAQN